jgi:hypothetical protein
MPVVAKFYGIVIRMLCVRLLGARIHAFYENWELVIGLTPLRIIEGEAPNWVQNRVMTWAAKHEKDLLNAWNCCAHGHRPGMISSLV